MAKFTHEEIRGIGVPLATPLNEKYEIDETGTQRLVRHVIGPEERPYVDAIFINGLTGEFPWTKMEHKKKMLDVTMDECGGRLPVLFGSTGETIDETTDLCVYGEEHGADAVVIAPLYFRGSNRGLPEIMKEIVEAVEIPVYIYNNPAFAEMGPRKRQRNIKTAIYKRLLMENENIWGNKDSSGDMKRFQNYQRAAANKEGAVNFMGDESKMMLFSDTVPSFANLDPELCRSLYVHTLDMDDRRFAEQSYVNTAGEIIYCGKRKIRQGLKYALSILGICDEFCLEPGEPLTQDEKTRINKFVESHYKQ